MSDETRSSPRSPIGDYELQNLTRLASMEVRLENLERAAREQAHVYAEGIRNLHQALVEHMRTEEAERRQWGGDLSTLVERVSSKWVDSVEVRLDSLRDASNRALGVMAVILCLVVPLTVSWLHRVFGLAN